MADGSNRAVDGSIGGEEAERSMEAGWFDRLAERGARAASHPAFFVLVLAAILAWLPTVWLWDQGLSDLLIDGLANPLSLLLLLLIQNSQHRGSRAKDKRQDAMEEALALVLEELAEESGQDKAATLHEAARQLRRNARLTERHASAGLD